MNSFWNELITAALDELREWQLLLYTQPVIPLFWCVCVCVGGLHSLVCQICDGDKGNSLFAFVAARRCKQTLETHKSKEAFLQHLWENWASLGVSENRRPPPHPPSPCWNKESGSPVGLLRRTPVCLCSRVYFLCVVHTVFVCQIEGAFPSRAANHLLTVKQPLDDGWALCMNSLSVPVAVQLRADHTYIT